MDSQKAKLDEAQQGAKNRQMLDLEMTAYERTIASLQAELTAKSKQVDQHAETSAEATAIAESLRTQRESIESTRSAAIERADQLKQLLVKRSLLDFNLLLNQL